MAEPVDVISQVCTQLAAGRQADAADLIKREYPFAPTPRVKRRYTNEQALRVFIRDGFVDRYTGARLVFPPVLHIIHDAVPEVFPHHPAWKLDATHPAFNDLSATLDHVVPVAAGGLDDDSNWLTTSMAINFAKNSSTVSGLQWTLRPPGSFAEWDGLLHWFLEYVQRSAQPPSRSAVRRWINPAKRVLAAV